MADWIEKLKFLLDEQKKLQKTLDSAIQEATQDVDVNELENLRRELRKTETELNQLKKESRKMEEENQSLRASLREQILDEKLNIIKLSKEKLETYFQSVNAPHHQKLSALEEDLKQKFQKINRENEKELKEEKDILTKEIDALYQTLSNNIRRRRETAQAREAEAMKAIIEGMETLGNEPLDEKTIEKRIKQNKIEMKIGLNWISKLGIVLILIGIGFTATMTYHYLNNYLKGILFFLIGICFLGGGEFLMRRDKAIFAKTLIGGGVAVLFASIFYSYFSLQIISMNVGLLLSILVTVTVLALAVRYNSKTVISLGLIGGYLPFITFAAVYGLKDSAIYIGMGYLFLLNLSVLALSFWKRWNISNFISFLLNIPAMLYLVFQCQNTPIAITYTMATFLLYLVAVLIYPMRNRISLNTADVVLLGLNTTISAGAIYGLFETAGINTCRGLLALLFTLIYICLGLFVKKRMENEKKTFTLFFITALTFAVLMIPFQFGMDWLSVGWLIEAVLLIIFGRRQGYRFWEKMGWIVFGLCLGTFYFIDCLYLQMESVSPFFDVKFLFITAGQIMVFMTYQYDILKNKLSEYSNWGKLIRAFKYLTIINLYLFIVYNGIHYYHMLSNQTALGKSDLYDYFAWMIFASITMAYGFVLSKVRAIADRFTKGLHIALSIIADLVLAILISTQGVLTQGTETDLALRITAFGILIIFNILVLLNVRELIVRFLKSHNKSLEFYPLWIGILLLGNITAYLIVQFNLGGMNLLLSFAYLFLAIGCILYGFWRKYLYVRIYGLALTIFSLGKLLIFDLNSLDKLGKTLAYFGFGILLLLISYIYQRVNASFKTKTQDDSHE